MKVSNELNKDLKLVAEYFPKLKFSEHPTHKFWILDGELDICDGNGNYWETFDIIILIPQTYPNCIPFVGEKSKIIPREEKRHISKEGLCCIDVDHNLLYMSKKGIRIFDFIQTKVYPYFANQLFYNINGQYAAGEYLHFFDGIRQFYSESLSLFDASKAILILEKILLNQIPGRNDNCICGSMLKFKNCHRDSVDFLKYLGKDRIKKDIEGFKEYLDTADSILQT